MVNGGGQKETLALLESQRNSAERGGEVTTVCLETFKEADDRAEGQKSPRKGRRSTKGVQYADEILNTELTTSEATAYACDPSTSG
jgi:hypothetical protein